jgi:hypothetical protein
MKTKVINYTFDKSAKTVTFTDYTTIRLDSVLLVVNATDNIIIYNFADPALGGTVGTNILTLTYDTSSMANTDKLLIYYDDPEGYQQTGGIYNLTAPTVVDGDRHENQIDVNGNNMVTLATLISGEDQTNDLLKVEERFSYKHHVGTAGSVSGTVKSGAGFLHTVAFGKHTAGGTYTLYDSVGTSATVIAIIGSDGAAVPTLYDVSFTTGLTIVSGSVCDVTLSYR